MSEDTRKRASLFGEAEVESKSADINLKLERFKPKKAPQLDTSLIETISEDTGFTTKHAKPKKGPAKRDGRRLKKSSRTSQFNVRLKPQNAERFWNGAEKEGYEYADDFLNHLLDLYENGG